MRPNEPPPAGDTILSTLRVLAMLAIAVGCAPAAVLAERPSSLRHLSGVAYTEPAPQTGPAHVSRESCPYRFDSDMPAATFCVYRGVAWDGADEECATDVVVIWSSFTSQAPVGRGPAAKTFAANKEIYLGFVADPGLVVRALVDPRQSDRAEIVEYTAGSEEAPQPLAGEMTLPAVRLESAEVLSMDLREPRRVASGNCAFASYSGTFVGMIGPPTEATTFDPAIEPPQWGSASVVGSATGHDRR